MRSRFLGIVALLALLLLTSCSGFKDIDKRFMVTAMGVDASPDKDNPIRVILKLAIPAAEIQPGKEAFQLVVTDAPTVSEAVRLMKSKVDKELDFGLTKVILFGDELAKKGIEGSLDWFVRRRDVQGIAFTAVAKPSAEEILAIKPPSERLAGNALILSFGETGTETSYISTAYLYDVYRRTKEKGLTPYMPIVAALPDTYNINSTALFDSEGTKRGELNPDETRLFNELLTGQHKTSSKVKVGDKTVMITLSSFKSKFKIVTLADQAPYLQLNVNAGGNVEQSELPIQYSDLRKFSNLAEQEFSSYFESMLTKLQKLKLDPLGFGLKYRASRHHPKTEYEEWLGLYPDLDIRVNVDFEIRSPGTIH